MNGAAIGAGLHASAILKDPTTYEHIDPGLVGNERVIPMSNQAGQSNLRARLAAAGIVADAKDARLGRILEVVKEREDQGYAYDGAQASFELLARRELGLLPVFFEVTRYRVTVERRGGRSLSEAVVEVSWSGGPLSDAHYDEFALMMKLPDAPGRRWFKVMQQCAQGANDWSQIPAEGQGMRDVKMPAAVLDLLPEESRPHH